jgi:hypothetical protein
MLGGGVTMDTYVIGGADDPWRLAVPDVRMAPNQFWPMHWHGCWIAVIVLDGRAMLGDWWMHRGDVLVAPAQIEYGPVLNGPEGCQLLEIFARDVDSWSGYAPEFRDHPTVTHMYDVSSTVPERSVVFDERPPECRHNAGRQTTPLATVPGLVTGSLRGGQRWDLGDADDPDRGVILDTKLPNATTVPSHHYRDWRGLFVFSGSVRAGDTAMTQGDLMVFEPGADVPELVVGSDGVHLLEFAKTAAAVDRIFGAEVQRDSAAAEVLSSIGDVVFE